MWSVKPSGRSNPDTQCHSQCRRHSGRLSAIQGFAQRNDLCREAPSVCTACRVSRPAMPAVQASMGDTHLHDSGRPEHLAHCLEQSPPVVLLRLQVRLDAVRPHIAGTRKRGGGAGGGVRDRLISRRSSSSGRNVGATSPCSLKVSGAGYRVVGFEQGLADSTHDCQLRTIGITPPLDSAKGA